MSSPPVRPLNLAVGDVAGTADDGSVQRRLRRATLRAHHPDLGGNAAELIAALHRLEAAEPTRSDRFNAEVVFVRRPRGTQRWVAWWKSRRHPPARRVL